jgi:hypothetical protein
MDQARSLVPLEASDANVSSEQELLPVAFQPQRAGLVSTAQLRLAVALGCTA